MHFRPPNAMVAVCLEGRFAIQNVIAKTNLVSFLISAFCRFQTRPDLPPFCKPVTDQWFLT